MTFLILFTLGFIPIFILFYLFQKSLPAGETSLKTIIRGPFEYAIQPKNEPMQIVVANSLDEALAGFEGIELDNVFVRLGGNRLNERTLSNTGH